MTENTQKDPFHSTVEVTTDDNPVLGTPLTRRNIKIGRYCIIEPGVIIGKNTVIGDFVKLKTGTVIGEDCHLDDYVNTSGYCEIGNGVIIKRCTMIGQATRIGDKAWIGSGVTTTRLKNPFQPDKEEWVTIGDGAMVGSRALLLAGSNIGAFAKIAAGAIINGHCPTHSTWIGQKAQQKITPPTGELVKSSVHGN